MLRVEVNPTKNRIVIALGGMLGVEDVHQHGAEIARAVAKLKPGFDCVTDITAMKTTSTEAAAEVGKVQAALVKAGMRQVARVVGSKIAGMQLSRTATSLGYQAQSAPSETEAHALLDAQR
jgi:hypothetical protein